MVPNAFQQTYWFYVVFPITFSHNLWFHVGLHIIFGLIDHAFPVNVQLNVCTMLKVKWCEVQIYCKRVIVEIYTWKKYDYVLCGHIHEPKIIQKENKNGSTLYLNSGDWVENLTALEYNNKRWKCTVTMKPNTMKMMKTCLKWKN